MNGPNRNTPTGQAIHDAADEARDRVGKTYAKIDELERDPNLTAVGKAQAIAKVAEQAVADIRKSRALSDAKAAVARQQQIWAAKYGLDDIGKPADDIGLATIHAQIRERVSSMTSAERMSFLAKNASDPVIAAAILSAPAFLSGLADHEMTMVRHQVESRSIPPEVAEARVEVAKALAKTERGWTRSIEVIEQRGGLQLSKDDAVSNPSPNGHAAAEAA